MQLLNPGGWEGSDATTGGSIPQGSPRATRRCACRAGPLLAGSGRPRGSCLGSQDRRGAPTGQRAEPPGPPAVKRFFGLQDLEQASNGWLDAEAGDVTAKSAKECLLRAGHPPVTGGAAGQHLPCLPGPTGEEVERLHVDAGDVDAQREVGEAEPLDPTQPLAELVPWHVERVRLRDEILEP
jgi:hypothetical protein